MPALSCVTQNIWKLTHLNSSSSPATPQPPEGHQPHFLTRINASTALRGAQNLLSHLVFSSLLWILPISTCTPFTSISCKAFLQNLSGSCPFSIPLETMFRIILHHIWRGSTASRLVSPPSGFLHL